MRGERYAHGGGGGRGRAGNLRVAKTPPLQSGVCGVDIAGSASPTIICAHMGINGNGEWEDHDAARRVATSSENRENRFKPPYSKKRPRRKTRRGSIVYRGHFLTGREVLITQFNLTKAVAMRRAALL